ncbi:MAG: hypothetical protein ACPG44_07970 [Polaribacter sp.]
MKYTTTEMTGVRQISHFRLKSLFLGKIYNIMTRKEQALKVFEDNYDQWENNPTRMESGYDYESTYTEMMQKVGQEVLQVSVGKVPKSKNSKKNFKLDLEL